MCYFLRNCIGVYPGKPPITRQFCYPCHLCVSAGPIPLTHQEPVNVQETNYMMTGIPLAAIIPYHSLESQNI